jgi:hypothetical protein
MCIRQKKTEQFVRVISKFLSQSILRTCRSIIKFCRFKNTWHNCYNCILIFLILSCCVHLKIFSPSPFWEFRLWKHLCRLVVTNYLLQQTTKRHSLLFPEKRHLFFRFLPSKLLSPFGEKQILGIAIAIHLFDKFEHFDDEHVLFTIQKRMTGISLVKGSRILYRKLDKEPSSFSLQDRKMLKKNLGARIKGFCSKTGSFSLYHSQ